MFLLWGIRNLGMEILFHRGNESATEAENRLQCWIKEQVKAAKEQGKQTVQASEIGKDLQIVLQDRINQNKERFVNAVFNRSDVELNALQLELTGLANVYITAHQQHDPSVRQGRQGGNMSAVRV